MSRYGEAIEADFHHHYGLDLLDFFRLRLSWRKFRALLERLPSSSHYAEAVALDEELAEERAGAEQGKKPPPGKHTPRISEFNPVVAELTVVSDRLGQLLMAMSGGTAKVEPRPRPVVAAQKIEERARVARLRGLEDEVLAAQRRWKHTKQ